MKAIITYGVAGILLFTQYVTSAVGQGIAMKAPVIGTMPDKMQMHGTAIVGNRIYVFGGDQAGGAKTTKWTSKVQSAAIDSKSCLLTGWRNEEPLPQMRAYMTNMVEVVNDKVYVVGGAIAKVATEENTIQRTNSVVWAAVDEEGKLKGWKTSEGAPGDAILHAATCSTDKSLFVVGGQAQGKKAVSSIMVADFSDTGELANWRAAGELPMTIYNHGACIQNGRLYVWGGHTATGVQNPRVVSAPVADSAIAGAWREEAPMPEPTYGASNCGINDYVVAIGGRYKGSVPTNDIWFARFDNTQVKGWQKVSSDLQAKAYHSLGLYKDKGWVFITGGMNKTPANMESGGIVDAVQAFQIPQPAADQLQLAGGGNGNGTIGAGLAGMDRALKQASTDKKNVLAFFYSPAVPACKRFWDNVSAVPAFKGLSSKYSMAAVNTADADTTWMYKLGVFKVPCMVEVTPDGKAVKSSMRLQTMEDLTAFLEGK